MNTCQICGREIKDSTGVIAHHGFQRPGDGWQTQSCIGARELPYEKSRDIIPKAIEEANNYIKKQEDLIKVVKQGEMPIPFLRSFVEPSHHTYKIRQDEYIVSLEHQIKLAKREIERLQKRYDDWKEKKK